MNKEKSIVFSKEVDSSINGFAVGISFSLISAFMFWKSDYFSLPVITYSVGALLGAIGIWGCGIEISRIIRIKGFSDFILGAFFLLLWGVLYFVFNLLVLNVIGFLLLVLGCYGSLRGLFFIGYSFAVGMKGKGGLLKNLLLLLTQLSGVILTILNILKIFGLFGTTT